MLYNLISEKAILTSINQKSPQALEYYLQYLELKEEIVELSHRLDVQQTFFKYENLKERQRLEEAVAQMKKKLNLLNVYGVTVEELLFLSMNIDLRQFNNEPITPGGKI